MPEHPNATRARALFHALWDDGNTDAALDSLSDEFVWINDIGAGPCREVRGRDGALALQLWWFDFFAGNFRHELVDICASDDRVIEMLREVGEKDGHVFDNTALYVYEVDPVHPERFSGLRTYDRDRENITEFWSHYPDLLTADLDALLAPYLPAPTASR